jgi:tungstate transport system substrate-binding protein
MKKVSIAILVLSFSTISLCAEPERLRLAPTTSVEHSGLLAMLIPAFEANSGMKVDVVVVGTGKALRLGESGDVDAVLVHSREAEDRFLSQGYGVNRRDVMHNDFVILGPPEDPASIAGLVQASEALRRIAEQRSFFISRGDDSGTHKRERSLWEQTGTIPTGDWYKETGQDMGSVLTIANTLRAYTISDRATYTAFKDKIDLRVLVAGDPILFNPYSVIAINPAEKPYVNYSGAIDFIEWITSVEAQDIISNFKIGDEILFFPSSLPHKMQFKPIPPGILARKRGTLIRSLYAAGRLLFSGDKELYYIALTSLRFSLFSTIIASLLSLPLVLLLSFRTFRGKKLIISVLNTLMALPTVVIGLLVFSFVSSSGPLESVRILFRPAAVIIGQTILCFPIISSLVYGALSKLDRRLRETLVTMGASRREIFWMTLKEGRIAVGTALLAGFGRVIGEIGISMILGGNILWYTRTLPTAIALETTKGEFETALALGIILLLIAFIVNLAFHAMLRHERDYQ